MSDTKMGRSIPLNSEWQLLDSTASSGPSKHDFGTAPVFTGEAHEYLSKDSAGYTQYGILGRIHAIHSKDGTSTPTDARMCINTNAPFSAVVCGVQGSGKSHTVATMLESMLITKTPAIGSLTKALCGLVLHYGEGGPSSLPSEVAWLARSAYSHVKPPPVTVYVSHSVLKTMKMVYEPLGSHVTVEPLYFKSSELDAAAFLSMMAVGTSDSAPLYMQVFLSILRKLGENYTYEAFLAELKVSKRGFSPPQLSGLKQRMALLESFLEPSPTTGARSPRFSPGRLTIVDLSDPFLDSSSACGVFEIILRLFTRAKVDTGKVLVVDEAHKYLSNNGGSSGLNETLLGLVRQQRHLAMRVIISTQEPTVIPPVLLDLCSVMIIHRFSSPSWWEHLTRHVSADFCKTNAFDQVVQLQTGQAIILAPSGVGVFDRSSNVNAPGSDAVSIIQSPVSSFDRRYLVVTVRKRVTADGGSSVLVV